MKEGILKLKQAFKSLKLDLSDYAFGIGFLFSLPFYILSWLFMVTRDPSSIPFKPWMMIVCFVFTALFWSLYFYLEVKKGHIKNHPFTWIYAFFMVFSLVTVLVQPRVTSVDVEAKFVNQISWDHYGAISAGDVVHLDLVIPGATRLFFAFATLVITTFIYILLIVLPKRIRSIHVITFIGVIVYIFLLVLAVYSYIVEGSHYIPFLKALFSGDIDGAYANSVKSFIVHRVPYGACMMLGVIISMILHSITKKWYWVIPGVFSYINMIFTYCKTSIALSALVVLLYIIFRLIVTLKEHKKRNIVVLSCIGFTILVGLILVLISVTTKGKYISLFYKVFSSFTDSRTIRTRTYIWNNINQLLSNGWWLIGRGFGTYNYMLYPMNLVNGDDVCPSHSTYYAVMGAGGVINLIGFVLLYGYFVYVFVKCFEVNKELTIGLSVGVLAFFLYSFTEGVNYIIVAMMIPLFMYRELINQGIEK